MAGAGAWPLTGRAEEVQRAGMAVSATDGPCGVVIVGPAGVGKSRLAQEVLDRAEADGCVVRWVAATSSARSLPLGAFAEWVDEQGADQLNVVRGVIDTLTETSGDARVVVGVDDAHLLDDLSAFVVHQLVLRDAASVIVTVRRGEPVPDAIRSLWKDEHLERLDLPPLTESASTTLVHSVLSGPLDPRDMRRLWALTRGNVLYLRNIVEQELCEGRLVRHGELWRWSGEPVVSPSLVELIEARMGVLPAVLAEVVDVLAVGEPLDMAVLTRIVDADAVEQTEARGLIALEKVGDGPKVVARVAHPLYGEVRRAKVSPMRLRTMNGLVATALARYGGADMRATVRRASLCLDSDLPADPDLYTRAANGALWQADLVLADRLAAAAIEANGSIEARFVRAQALSWLSRGEEADSVLAEIEVDSLSTTDSARLAFVRAVNLVWALGRPVDAWSLVESAETTHPSVRLMPLTAFHVVYWALAGRPVRAIESARDLELSELPDVVAAVTFWAMVVAFGDTGRMTEARSAADDGNRLIARSFEASQTRFVLTDGYVGALVLSGRIGEAADAARDLRRVTADLPGTAHILGTAISGMAALAAGRVGTALPLLDLSVLALSTSGETNGFGYRYQLGRTRALALSGDTAAARRSLSELEAHRHPSWAYLEPERLLVMAWVAAAHGALTEARATARSAADNARMNRQFAQEVLCLQTATQFGDRGTVHRLAQLATTVDGPRASAVTAYAVAFAADDGSALDEASLGFEKMGDSIAAADAAAHAAIAYRHHDLRGSALVSSSRGEAIAQRCGSFSTPALREASTPLPLTSREREIVSLVRVGMSNREIAERLTLSVRTVEGHLYRATAKTGVRNRDELGAILDQR
ncbi:LuxR C-terminal-related transcriptional regulator [Rhodococcoides yunnanense]|uniref:LuxR C-terminal-related transcriptional regulator n=1 Tax=Rhodococcoides yunnanense TaxID=278209 RepID=UPI002481CF13|nr:LuxR family transcriptional regulator [Rhodococcus yunnanensis]